MHKSMNYQLDVPYSFEYDFFFGYKMHSRFKICNISYIVIQISSFKGDRYGPKIGHDHSAVLT